VRQVDACELERAGVRAASLERDRRDDQAGKPQPDYGWQQSENAKQAEQDDRGSQGERSERDGFRKSPARYPLTGDDPGREREREARGRRRHREGEGQPDSARRLREGQPRGGGCDTKGQRAPEAAPVEPDRLGNELADRARCRR